MAIWGSAGVKGLRWECLEGSKGNRDPSALRVEGGLEKQEVRLVWKQAKCNG